MTCAPGPPTFRLLDALVGWEPRDVCRLSGLDDEAGLRLALAQPDSPDARRHLLLGWFGHPWVAPGCGRCAWYLLTPAGQLVRRDACTGRWVPAWSPDCDPRWLFDRPATVAARGHLLAVAFADRVLLWRNEGGQLVAEIPGRARALAFTSRSDLLVAVPGSADLLRYDRFGVPRGRIATGVDAVIERVTTGRDCTIWLLTEDQRVWMGSRDTDGYRPARDEELTAAVEHTTLYAASDAGFCLNEPGPDGDPVTVCFDWFGEPLDESVARPTAPPLATSGQLLTAPIDSGIPRCRWHRVRVDADVPPDTTMSIAVATTEESLDAAPPGLDGWNGCAGGVVHPEDWRSGPPGALDFLVDQPPGRYLHLRLRSTGNGIATPTIRRIRLDFPRITSADSLPAVYRTDPTADDFTERFLSLFDASLEELDLVVERAPALLDAAGVPDEALPWLAGLIGLAFDADWDASIRRELLAAAPELYRRRGTPWALREAIRIVFKTDAVVHELAAGRAWAALDGRSRLGSVALFGRSSARFRLGGSVLSRAPLRSYGDPDTDPLTAQAYRFRVLLPPVHGGAEPDRAALTSLINRQAPAHTVGEVHIGGLGFVVGMWTAVGVDTALVSLPAPVLGRTAGRGRAVRLARHSVLWPGHRGSRTGIRLGTSAAVGLDTVAK